MELVEGDTLADRIGRGPLPIEETLRIALQIAEALEAAHEKGIVHRDLKPANVKIDVRRQGQGPRFRSGQGHPTGFRTRRTVTHSPTLSIAATNAGVVLGTAAYMSPEQAKGHAADHRSDVFSFGVVLHEMLTGRQPFQGETAAEVMASVMVREADVRALPPALNPRLGELLKRCLEKNPRKRWQAIGDVRAELEAIAVAPQIVTCDCRDCGRARAIILAPRARLPRCHSCRGLLRSCSWRPWTSRMPTGRSETIVTRFTFPLGNGQAFTNTGRQLVAMSPDGTKMVYVANQRLWLRLIVWHSRRSRWRPGQGPQRHAWASPIQCSRQTGNRLFSVARRTRH